MGLRHGFIPQLTRGIHYARTKAYHAIISADWYVSTVYPKKYAHGFCFVVLCCGYTLTDFPISIRLTSLALWESNDCPSASKATLMNMDKYFMWIHYERLHNHNKAKHNKTVCIVLGIYCNPHWQPRLAGSEGSYLLQRPHTYWKCRMPTEGEPNSLNLNWCNHIYTWSNVIWIKPAKIQMIRIDYDISRPNSSRMFIGLLLSRIPLPNFQRILYISVWIYLNQFVGWYEYSMHLAVLPCVCFRSSVTINRAFGDKPLNRMSPDMVGGWTHFGTPQARLTLVNVT